MLFQITFYNPISVDTQVNIPFFYRYTLEFSGRRWANFFTVDNEEMLIRKRMKANEKMMIKNKRCSYWAFEINDNTVSDPVPETSAIGSWDFP